jgi:hypothetical protein
VKDRSYHRKKQQPVTWDDIRDQGSAYRQAPSNGPNNDQHSGYTAARSPQAVEVDSQADHYGTEARPRISPDLSPALVSAPVSRNADSYNYSPPTLTADKIRLSAEEISFAKNLGLSPQEFAQQKLRLHKEKLSDPLRYRGQG